MKAYDACGGETKVSGLCECCGEKPATARCHGPHCDNACASADDCDPATAVCEDCMELDEISCVWRCKLCMDHLRGLEK